MYDLNLKKYPIEIKKKTGHSGDKHSPGCLRQ